LTSSDLDYANPAPASIGSATTGCSSGSFDKVELIATDEHFRYRYLKWALPHEVVAHSVGEYVRSNVHTQSIDSFWSLLKRGIIGTYHNVSKKYLPLYLAEFTFRFNNRHNPDIFGTAIAGS
jgi:hypothetical protein